MAKKQETKSEQLDSLADDVLSIINKKFKEFPNAAGYLSNANLVTDWVSTGCDMLDLAISNRPHGGIAYSVITEISGQSGSSKSLIAAHILANCQKQGGLGVLYDTEKAVGMLDFYQSIGLDPSKLVYIDSLRALEEIYDSIELIIDKVNLSNKTTPLVIVVDSVMGASTKLELQADYEKEGWATAKAIINSKAMRKLPSLIAGRKIAIVLINQVRANLNAGFGGDKFTTSGGNAIPFTATTRLRTTAIGGRTKGKVNGMEVTVSERVQVTVIKNRLGPPRRQVTFDIRYDSGIDNYGSWLAVLKDFGFLKVSGAYYTYEYVNSDTGELVTKRFMAKDFKKLLEDNPPLKEMIYNQICETYIMSYKTDGIDLNELEVETFSNEDDV